MMNAGRELDVLIAEKLFSLKVDWEFGMPCSPALQDRDDEWGIIPNYSMNMSDAWLVVEKMSAMHTLTLEQLLDKSWRATFIHMPRGYVGYAKSASHAICLAALQVFGIVRD
jgi:hypothetical protein